MPHEENKKKQDNRWWEFYFVRYFVGTAIGAIIVLFLAMSESTIISQGTVTTIFKSLKPEKFESGYILVLATVGLAFCYVASSPILVLHATRGCLLKIQVRSNWRLFLIFTFIVIVIASAQIYLLYNAFKPKGNVWASYDFYAGSMVLLTFSGIFIAQFFLLGFSLRNQNNNAFKCQVP